MRPWSCRAGDSWHTERDGSGTWTLASAPPSHSAWAPTPSSLVTLHHSGRSVRSKWGGPSKLPPSKSSGCWPELSFQHQAEQPSTREGRPGRP